ncbi:MAG: cytochrome c-type biogenesis protein CcmH [candidate division KSB1 bacterium]|nr:cytochrome c-type biogenesis protein CcmH [candidate division KSB1 bacterium]MDQ7064136.1 cytochrome c-type biogenesis protein CcmH [candidate division KSB1 bacterium]
MAFIQPLPALPERLAAQDSTQQVRTTTTEEVREIARLLIAPCCWSETADMHQSQAARQVREQIRQLLMQGYTKQQILDAFEEAYGERILAKPHARGFNLLVWVLPGVVLMVSMIGTWKFLKRIQVIPPANAGSKARSPRQTERDRAYLERVEKELDEIEG